MRDRADRNRPLCDLHPQGIAEQRATKLAIEASQAAAWQRRKPPKPPLARSP